MRARHIVATLCAAGLIAAACGSDDTSSADTAAPADSGAPSDSGAEMEVPEDWPDTLVFTLTPSQETGGLIETAQPLADLLSEQLGVTVEALVPTDYAGVIVALESGQAQIAGGLGPRQMVQAEDQADAELILQAERFGSLLYVTQWYTNDPDTYCADEPVADEDGFLFCNGVLDATGPEDGPIGADELSKLEGQTIAFVDQGSTSGYAIPALQLSEAGVDPIDGIDALFAGGHDTAVQAVYDGDATVGVSFNDARGQLVEAVPDVGEKVVVFGWSGPIPNDGFAVAGDLPDDLVAAITAAFIEIAGTEEGAALLEELYEIDGLVPVESSDFDVIRDLEEQLGDVLS
jgi:phosphonate transport system substrate-binding protein